MILLITGGFLLRLVAILLERFNTDVGSSSCCKEFSLTAFSLRNVGMITVSSELSVSPFVAPDDELVGTNKTSSSLLIGMILYVSTSSKSLTKYKLNTLSVE